MKLDLGFAEAYSSPARVSAAPFGADSEYGLLDTVLTADPAHLEIVPCNAMSREALGNGHATDAERARRQHRALLWALADEGVDTVTVPARPGLPDLVFTRDTSLMTPWGLLGLQPGAAHPKAEVDAVLAAADARGALLAGRIQTGRIEGGDVAMLRPGLLLIGISGERTDEEGAEALAALFRRRGWRVILHRFDPRFLHLDTLFCMVDRDLALGCPEILGSEFIERLADEGIELLPAGLEATRALGCNLLSLGDRRIVIPAACAGIAPALAARGYRSIAIDIGEFTLCGGGIHCLTMPLSRRPG